MSVEENLALVRQRFEGHPILGDADATLRAIYAPDVILHGPGEQFKGIDGIKRAAEVTRNAFSDIAFTVDEMAAAGDDRVVTRISGRSRHTGTFQGVPATDRWVTVNAVIISRIADGRIVEEWRSMNWS